MICKYRERCGAYIEDDANCNSEFGGDCDVAGDYLDADIRREMLLKSMRRTQDNSLLGIGACDIQTIYRNSEVRITIPEHLDKNMQPVKDGNAGRER